MKFGTGTLESRSSVSWTELRSFYHITLSLGDSMESAGNERLQGHRRGSPGTSLEGLCTQ